MKTYLSFLVLAALVWTQAGLFIDGINFCGGSLITNQTVLTAAHCVGKSVETVKVVLGAHKIMEAEATQKSFKSTNISVHEDWDAISGANDIAVVILPVPVNLDDNIQVVQLAESGSESEYVGRTAEISGWGRTSYTSMSFSSVLREGTVSIIPNSECSMTQFIMIKGSQLCVSGAGSVSSCNGDDGGPLLDNRVQIGISSGGDCLQTYPSVYTRVSSYRTWIASNQV